MNSDDFERGLSDRMKARAAELDRTTNPPPPLAALLATGQPTPRSSRRTTFRLGLTVASVAVVALVVVAGSFLLQKRPAAGPMPSATPSVTPSVAATSSATATPYPLWSLGSPPPPTPIPTWSPIAPSSTGGLTVLEPSWMVGGEVLWAPDGQHFAVISSGGGDKNVYMFDKAGTWVGEAPAWEAAWGGNDTLIVLASDPTSNDDFATAYIAHIGYNGLGTMQALPGRYEFLYGNGNGTVALQTAQGYAVWRNGSLLPEVVGDGPLSISSDGSLMAVEDPSGLAVVRTDTGQVVRSWPEISMGKYPGGSLSPDGRHLALTGVIGSPGNLVVLSVSDGKRTDLLKGGGVYRETWVGNDRMFAGDDAEAWWLLSLDGARTRLGNGGTAYRDGAISTQGWAALVPEASLGTVQITTSGKTSTVALPSPATGLYWSPDGTELVVTCNPDVLGRDAQVVLLRP